MNLKPSFMFKLERAEQHLHELRPEIERWLKSGAYSISDDPDSDATYNILNAQLVRPMPSLISQLIGDCLQNLRSAIDHLVYTLALNCRPSLADKEAMETAFPIFITEAGFRTQGKGRIKYLSPGAQTIIDGLQPYRTKEPTKHFLWSLKTLNDIDKHRRILVTFTRPLAAGVKQPLGTRMLSWEWSDNDVSSEGKTEIARYRCIDPKTSRRVKVEFRPTLIVVFGDITTDERVVQVLLDNIGGWIGSVLLPRLIPLL